MFKLNLRSMCLILCMFFLTLAVALIYADTGTAAATPWWAELLTAAVPALVIFITKEIRSHVKDRWLNQWCWKNSQWCPANGSSCKVLA